MSTRLMPNAKVGNLPKTTNFRKDDVLYKIVSGRIVQFLVIDDTGECRLVIRAYEESGRLSSRTLRIQGNELGFYKIDHLATNLRRAYFEAVSLSNKSAEKHDTRKAG